MPVRILFTTSMKLAYKISKRAHITAENFRVHGPGTAKGPGARVVRNRAEMNGEGERLDRVLGGDAVARGGFARATMSPLRCRRGSAPKATRNGVLQLWKFTASMT